ncbi:zf-HC2 domain-containing protein [Rhodovulum tesquicola]|uniref:anti-sigma factor family protein n=1 Tax=Rhodovulum tesquicola TaxID=540254 RepID=UPI002097C5FC|nr:zf-HC2 domain-containing protein [Rhodovulum tesquicola]MCO8146113.1 zf-HC2 domain-containing protein [Rhodovulum tesquicola]
MRETTMDKDRLAAFADGELSPEDAAAVVIHLADHPGDQAFIDDLMAANEALARAFAGPISDPVPPAILAAIEGRKAAPKVIALPRRPVLAAGGLALAASIALAVVLLPRAPEFSLALGPVATDSALHDHLQALPSGRTVGVGAGSDLTILATLPTPTGPCREVEVIDRAANRLDMLLACRRGTSWQVEVALSEPLPEAVRDQGYVPAGGVETEALTPWLDRMGAGMALDAAAEAAAIARGWQP